MIFEFRGILFPLPVHVKKVECKEIAVGFRHSISNIEINILLKKKLFLSIILEDELCCAVH